MSVFVKEKLVSAKYQHQAHFGTENIQSLVSRTEFPDMVRPYIVVTVDGVEIHHEQWLSVVPKGNQNVFIALVPQGSGGSTGKSIGLIIASLALAVFTYGGGLAALAPALGTGTALTVAQAGVMFVGLLAISLVFKPASLQPINQEDSAGYHGITGMRNQTRPFGAVRSIFGQYKLAPDVAAEPYILTAGDSQTIFALFDFGYGALDLSDIRIGNTSISRFNGVRMAIHHNYTNAPLQYFSNDHATEAFSVEVTNTATVIRATSIDDAISAHISIQFPLGLGIYHADGSFKGKKVEFGMYMRDVNGGAWIGIRRGTWNYFSYPLLNDAATSYSQTANLTDYYNQIPPPYGVTAQCCPGYTEVKGGNSFNMTIDGLRQGPGLPLAIPLIVQAGATITLHDGLVYIVVAANYLGRNTVTITPAPAGNFNPPPFQLIRDTYTVTLDRVVPGGTRYWDKWTIAPAGGYAWVPQFGGILGSPVFNIQGVIKDDKIQIGRSTSVPFVFMVGVGLPYPGEWEFLLIRRDVPQYTNTAINDRHLDKTVLVSIDSVASRKPLNFDTGHTIMELAITATDQISGMIDTLTAQASRHLNLYYGGVNTFGPTKNPAWIAVEILTGEANPNPVDINRVDLDAFSDWALWCDRLDANGNKFYECDANTDSEGTVSAKIRDVMATGRGSLSMRENKYTVIYDHFPTVPTQLITPLNSWNFSASRVFTQEIHALKCSYVDPNSDYQVVDIMVYADGYDASNTKLVENLNMPFTTRYEQAWRDGRYFLAQGLLRPEMFTLTMDIENLISERGDLVHVQYDVVGAGGVSTRIKEINGQFIELVEPVQTDFNSSTYKIRVRLGDGSQLELSVINQSSPNVVELGDPDPGLMPGDLVVFGEIGQVTEEFLISAIIPGNDFTAELTLVPIAREIQNSDTGIIPDYKPPVNIENFYPVCLADITYEQVIVYINRQPLSNLTVFWTPQGPSARYDIYTSPDGFDYKKIDTTTKSSFLLYDKKSIYDDDYKEQLYVQVIPVNGYGNSPPVDSCNPLILALQKNDGPPGKPLFFAGNINIDVMQLSWFPPAALDIAGFVLRYTPDIVNPDWVTAATELKLIPYNVTTASVNARIGSYMLKTINTSGVHSDDFALIRTTVPALVGLNIVQTVIENPLFIGTRTNVALNNNELALAAKGNGFVSVGTYDFGMISNVGDIHNCRVCSEIELEYQLSGGQVINNNKADVVIQIKTSEHNSVIADWVTLDAVATLADVNGSDWSGWQNLTAGYYTGKFFQFRAVLNSLDGLTTPVIKKLKVQIDMPDRTIDGQNLSSVVGGARVLFPSGAFKEKPTIAITEENLSPGDYFITANISQDGFDIEFFNSTDISIVATFDYLAKGYGQVLTVVNKGIADGMDDAPELMPDALAHLQRPDLLN